MDGTVRRIFVEKKAEFSVEANEIFSEIKENLRIKNLKSVRVLNRYDVAGLTAAEFDQVVRHIFSEPPLDNVYQEKIEIDLQDKAFAIEYLPGQYDQRADSAAQCIEILTQKDRPPVQTAKVIILKGEISDQELQKIKNYLINPIEAREASFAKPSSLEMKTDYPADVPVLTGFTVMDSAALREFLAKESLAMSYDDLAFCQKYFKDDEKRDPTLTEIKVIDTYWSDHCRHTTFLTEIEQVEIEPGQYTGTIREVYGEYLSSREYVHKNTKDISLMDIATVTMKEMKKKGLLPDLDESDEINACSVKTTVEIEIDGEKRQEQWLIMFKNETHNHPTEIEPFGGAATCLGGCIRDPLSGRAYAYQAMRLTGSGDPRTPVEDTLPGKLPQRKITIGAAKGYSSYGNQIGLATGQVTEIYDEGFIAKRMEIGAVIAAAPRQNVVRSAPEAGDAVILVGGRTGRDGCGGATGSSKEHNEESLQTCEAEVQKGNPVIERKIQRLFRNPQVSVMIKRCNDFGAGGVSVAIGELTDGVTVNLDAVPKKYEGLNGTELAISESQERMAVVVSAANAAEFIRQAALENLEATVVAEVTGERRLKMFWRDKPIVNLSRDFLNTNGVKQRAAVKVTPPVQTGTYFDYAPMDFSDIKEKWLDILSDLNICSQKGLAEQFDSSIGAGTILMPFGGKYQLTPTEGMVAKIPVLNGDTTTGTIMTYGYNPQIFKWSPFHGAVYAIVEALGKITAIGGDYRQARLTLQEYFEKLGQNSEKWGKPFSALLGAYYAQKKLNVPAIGGKDSMSGTFKNLNVPPVLAAFAVVPFDVRQAVSPEFKKPDSLVVYIKATRTAEYLPDFSVLAQNFAKVHELIKTDRVLAAQTVRYGGVAAALSKMTFGNGIGFEFTDFEKNFSNPAELFTDESGSFILELKAGQEDLAAILGEVDYILLGRTQEEPCIEINGATIATELALSSWQHTLKNIFPTRPKEDDYSPAKIPTFKYENRNMSHPAVKIAKPRVFIPVFPGTNCEYDLTAAFEKSGAVVETLVIRNFAKEHISQSVQAMTNAISQSQIIVLAGGFSAGDEPDGSGKFIAGILRNPFLKEAVAQFLTQKDGLMLGICNGFQALIKLGLVPCGQITDITAESPTLTYNKIGRHISCMAKTKVTSVLSPWFSRIEAGEIFTIPVSHGEGRFYAKADVVEKLAAKGQIAAQYVDFEGNATYDIEHNPNGSFMAIEAISSPDGRIMGKMGHSERIGANIAINVPGMRDWRIFEGGVNYFK